MDTKWIGVLVVIIAVVAYRRGFKPWKMLKKWSSKEGIWSRLKKSRGEIGNWVASGILAVIAIIAVYNLVKLSSVAFEAFEDYQVATVPWSQPAPSVVAQAAELRDAIELPFDTSFLFTAKAVPTRFVPGTGCKEWVRKVKLTHSFVLENQNGRFEVLPGQEVSVGDSEWLALSALGGPEAEVRINISGCDSSKAKSSTSKRS